MATDLTEEQYDNMDLVAKASLASDSISAAKTEYSCGQRLLHAAIRADRSEGQSADEPKKNGETTWGALRESMSRLAISKGDWGGIPLPIHGLELRMTPNSPWAGLDGFDLDNAPTKEDTEEAEPEPTPELQSDPSSAEETVEKSRESAIANVTATLDEVGKDAELLKQCMEALQVMEDFKTDELVNRWHSHSRSAEVLIFRNKLTKKTFHEVRKLDSAQRRLELLFNTTTATAAWSLQAEMRAMVTLSTHVSGRQFRHYMLTGNFVERSKRSGILYMFRKLRPTLAFTTRPIDGSQDEDARMIAALCLHPIGYYTDSFAGALVPTDDVIAHLSLMRGDEHTFWKKANHHTHWEAESGL